MLTQETPEAESTPQAHAVEEGSAIPDPPQGVGSVASQLKKIALSSKLNVLYIFVPVSLVCGFGKWNATATFITSFLSLIPLAAILGDLTEDLALRTNDAIGALINVTFGNATELIISMAALRLNQLDLIKMTLIGSVLGNMLLVLGSAFVAGGIKTNIMTFSQPAAETYMATLILACFTFMVPTAFYSLNPNAEDALFALDVSQQIAILLVVVYLLYIYFQLKTHKAMFEGADGDDDEEPQFSFAVGIVAIALVAVLISIISDFLVDSVSGAAERLRLSRHFIGIVLVPIVGNVAEHASAIVMAAKGKLDIALGVALGSSIQIAMFALPLTVVVSWLWGKKLDMNFSPFLATSLLVTTLLTYTTIANGSATWLTGCKLLCAYTILVIAFLNVPRGQ